MQNQFEEIEEQKWHQLIPQNYKIPTLVMKLTPNQTTGLIQSEITPKAQQFLDVEQNKMINEEIEKSKQNSLFPKINGRIPRDLPHQFSRKITNAQDLLHIMTTSEYILQNIHKGYECSLILRHFFQSLASNQNFYEVIVRDGYVLAIGQKYCDHIEQHPDKDIIGSIMTAVQDALPAIGMTFNCKKEHLKQYLFSIYCAKQSQKIITKITSIRLISDTLATNIFSPQQLNNYYGQIQTHKSQEDFYFENQGVIPLIKTILKKEDIRQPDMGEYMAGSQLNSADKVEEWKNFIKQSNQKLNQQEGE